MSSGHEIEPNSYSFLCSNVFNCISVKHISKYRLERSLLTSKLNNIDMGDIHGKVKQLVCKLTGLF